MYNEVSISKLIDRIGWSPALQPSDIVITDENSKSDSGRFFDSFHALATVENVSACVSNLDLSNDGLNLFLKKMKSDSVRQVLSRIYDMNPLALYRMHNQEYSINYLPDYSDVIIAKAQLFDEAIGFSLVTRFLQFALTTKRSNKDERIIGMSYQLLRGELSGFFNPEGVLMAEGANQNFEAALLRLSGVLFPVQKPRATLKKFR